MTATTYVYNAAQVIQELENGVLQRSYIYGEYIDSPSALYQETTGSVYFYVRDRRANIIGLVDTGGNIVESYEYNPFGQMLVYDALGTELPANAHGFVESGIGNPYGFTGRRWDPESGLWYYRNRMYTDYLGRFLQRDPAGFVDGYNLYAYVTNSPLIFVDPFGLEVTRDAVIPFSRFLENVRVWEIQNFGYDSNVYNVPLENRLEAFRDQIWNNNRFGSGG